jgi:hypothetical protein
VSFEVTLPVDPLVRSPLAGIQRGPAVPLAWVSLSITAYSGGGLVFLVGTTGDNFQCVV